MRFGRWLKQPMSGRASARVFMPQMPEPVFMKRVSQVKFSVYSDAPHLPGWRGGGAGFYGYLAWV
jgi:hypothetical protein